MIQKTQKISFAKTTEEIKSCHHVMLHLRPHLTDSEKFVEQVERQIEGGYHLAYLQDEGGIRSVTGFRFLEFLAWGKVLYIDDLVSDPTFRKSGYGSTLLNWVINQAKEKKCDQVHLDSGPQRHDAHRLYLNHGFKIMAHHFILDFRL